MNFVFISPHFPHTYWNFCDRLKKNGANVLGIGDASYDSLEDCLNLFQRMLRKEKRTLDEKALPALENLFSVIRQRSNFGNGRDVRHLKDLCVQKMVHRCVHTGGPAQVILPEDIPTLEEAMEKLNA